MSDDNRASSDTFGNYLQKELYGHLQNDSLVFEFLQEAVMDGLWYWDLDNPEHEWMSPKFWTTFGYDPTEKMHLASEWQGMIFEEDLEMVTQNFERHLQNPDHPYDQVVRYRHANGSTVWVRCRGFALHNTDGKPIRMIGAHTDVTDLMLKQRELMALKVSNRELQRSVDRMSYELAKANDLALEQTKSLRALQQTDPATGLLMPEYFTKVSLKRVQLASRLHTTINVAVIEIENTEYIIENVGGQELTNKLAEINLIAGDLFVGANLGVDGRSRIYLVDIGHSEGTFRKLAGKLLDKLYRHKWSMVNPNFSVRLITENPENAASKQVAMKLFKHMLELVDQAPPV